MIEGKKLRIAIISSYPPQKCGIAYYTRDMVETMLSKHSNLEFFILSEKRTWIPYTLKDYGRIHEKRVWDRHSNFYPLHIFNKILRIRPDIVMIQHEYGLYGSFGGFLLPILIFLLRLTRFPLVLTLHTVCPKRNFTKALRSFLRYPLRIIILRWIDVNLTNFWFKRFIAKIIIHSRGLADQLIKDYNFTEQKISVIPHGAPVYQTMDREEFKRKLGLEGKWVILSFGFLSYRKGYENVIKALCNLTAKYPTLLYLIAGTNQSSSGAKYLKELKGMVNRLNLENNVKFITKQFPQDEVPKIFGTADLVILPYLELFGDSGVLRQAAASGNPIITTDVGAFPEEIEDGVDGLVVPSADVNALKRAIERIFDNPEEAERMGESIRKKTLKNWSWGKVTEDVYRMLKRVSLVQTR